MSHIDDLQTIIEEITGYTLIQTDYIEDTTAIYLQPSRIVRSEDYEEFEFFNITVLEDTAEELAIKKKALLRLKTNLDFNYNNFDARGSITVTDGTDFAVTDAIVGTTSGATGTVYKIVDNTLYLKDITGTWQVEAINGKTATCTSTQTVILFPFYIMNSLVDYVPDININEAVGGNFRGWIRFEARWAL